MIFIAEGELEANITSTKVQGRKGFNGLESQQSDASVVVYLLRFGQRVRFWSFWREGETWLEARTIAEDQVRARLMLEE